MVNARRAAVPVILIVAVSAVVASVLIARPARPTDSRSKPAIPPGELQPRHDNLDVGGFFSAAQILKPWRADATLREIAREWEGVGHRGAAMIDKQLANPAVSRNDEILLSITKSAFQLYDGEAGPSYETLTRLRAKVERDPRTARVWLGTVMFLQGVSALRQGENDNCIACLGESSCIVPVAPAAVHTNQAGSRLAVKHFKEYLDIFPDDVGVHWLLEIAYMTLGETPDGGDSKFQRAVERFFHSEFDIGAFRDISHGAGLDGRFNQSGGAIMDDFDGDGLLDVVITCHDPTESMAFYRNRGDGTFEDRSKQAGVTEQLGGLICYQADYDNDGWLDIFIPRAAWYDYPMRPTLLRNKGGGGFVDVTQEAGLLDPVNSNAAAWGDFDNDGWIDLFVACERQENRLFRNKGNGTFENVTNKAGVEGDPSRCAKGCTWLDYDNDGYVDLYVNNLEDTGRLYHNQRDGRFVEVTMETGINGPIAGFACWSWDYDNDGWLDIFACSVRRDLTAYVKSMIGAPHGLSTGRLYRNLHGERFEDITKTAGLDGVYAVMGCNFADFDNDGWLDFYMGTGAPSVATLVPNRMFKNASGTRFADITGSSRTGHLQKGHGVACGDWDRDGDVDLFIEMGGAINGDKFHNILFQNPGQGNHYLTVKLAGRKTDRAAIGARIKVVTEQSQPRSIYRVVSSGSSFGANALQQTIGLGDAKGVSVLEIYWPASHTTQVFHDLAADQAIQITEFDPSYRRLDWKPIAGPR